MEDASNRADVASMLVDQALNEASRIAVELGTAEAGDYVETIPAVIQQVGESRNSVIESSNTATSLIEMASAERERIEREAAEAVEAERVEGVLQSLSQLLSAAGTDADLAMDAAGMAQAAAEAAEAALDNPDLAVGAIEATAQA